MLGYYTPFSLQESPLDRIFDNSLGFDDELTPFGFIQQPKKYRTKKLRRRKPLCDSFFDDCYNYNQDNSYDYDYFDSFFDSFQEKNLQQIRRKLKEKENQQQSQQPYETHIEEEEDQEEPQNNKTGFPCQCHEQQKENKRILHDRIYFDQQQKQQFFKQKQREQLLQEQELRRKQKRKLKKLRNSINKQQNKKNKKKVQTEYQNDINKVVIEDESSGQKQEFF